MPAAPEIVTKSDGSPDLSGVMESLFTEGMAAVDADNAAAASAGDGGEAPAAPAKGGDEPAKAVEPEKGSDSAPAKAAKAEPEKAADPAEPVQVADPYEGTTPLSLTVDGRPVVVDGILLADGGGLIPPDKLAAVQDRLTRGVQAEATVQRLSEQSRQNEHVLSQLSHTVGEDTYKGLAAFEAIKAESTATLEGSKAVLAALNDPDFVHRLAFANQNNDAAGAKALIAQVIDKASSAYQLSQVTGLREAFKLQVAGAPPAPIPADEALVSAVDTMLSHESLKGLAPEDRAAALRYFGPFASQIVRPATAEEAAKMGVRPGELIAEYGKMLPWMQDRLAERQRNAAQESERAKAEAAKLKTAGESAAFNARVQRNRQPTKTEPAKPAKPEQPRAPDGTFKKSKTQDWGEMLDGALAELNIAR